MPIPRRPDSFVEFEPGNRYADFNPDVDEVAAYGIGALVAGKVAAKAGLFKGLIAVLLASKKLLILGLIGLGLCLVALFSRRKAAQAAAPGRFGVDVAGTVATIRFLRGRAVGLAGAGEHLTGTNGSGTPLPAPAPGRSRSRGGS
jgi:hypothetical protein